LVNFLSCNLSFVSHTPVRDKFGVAVSQISPSQRLLPVAVPAAYGELPVPEAAPVAPPARRPSRFHPVPLRTDATSTYLAQHIAQEVLPPAGPDPGRVSAYLRYPPPAFEGLNYRATV
jgi:hypothetical protein